MAVDIVVVNYHTDELLKDFVDSVYANSFPGCTLVIIDVERQMLGKPAWLDPSSTYMVTPTNVGYGRACNLGALVGTNDVILFANADTRLTERFEECYHALKMWDDWAVLGPRQVNDSFQIKSAGIVGTERSISPRGFDQIDVGQFSFIDDTVKSVSGSLYFIKRSVWEQMEACSLYKQAAPYAVGAFLETPHYFEETFLSYHVRAHGFKIVYYGPVQMIHHWHAASPHGGWADQQFWVSQQMMREACAAHNIVCE